MTGRIQPGGRSGEGAGAGSCRCGVFSAKSIEPLFLTSSRPCIKRYPLFLYCEAVYPAYKQVKHMLFQELSVVDQYDGIWACSSNRCRHSFFHNGIYMPWDEKSAPFHYKIANPPDSIRKETTRIGKGHGKDVCRSDKQGHHIYFL